MVINYLNRAAANAEGESRAIWERESYFESLGANDSQFVETETTASKGEVQLSDSHSYRASAILYDLAEQFIRRRSAGQIPAVTT